MCASYPLFWLYLLTITIFPTCVCHSYFTSPNFKQIALSYLLEGDCCTRGDCWNDEPFLATTELTESGNFMR